MHELSQNKILAFRIKEKTKDFSEQQLTNFST